MITLAQIDSYAIFLALTAVAVGLEHMAFRPAVWQRRELARRAVGIQTVMALFLIVVWAGDADVWTWAMMQGAFVVAGIVKVIATYIDRLRGDALRKALGDHASEYTTPPSR